MIDADPLRVLVVCHNHPAERAGGAESYALDVFDALRALPGVEPVFLAKGGPPVGRSGNVHSGTFVSPFGDDPGQYLLYTDGYDYDWLNGRVLNADFYTKHVRDFLLAHEPDVVHFQHTQFLGYPFVREVRNSLPDAAIVYTLHEYLPICHNEGQMVRPVTGALCSHASPRRCHECFPSVSPQDFFLRTQFIKSHLSLVDAFLCPSRFLLDRYVRWGVAPERLHFVENGRDLDDRCAQPSQARPRSRLGFAGNGRDLEDRGVTSAEGRPRTRFGFFGQVNPFKGIAVLLDAMRLLASGETDPVERPFNGARRAHASNGSAPAPRESISLSIHGANLEHQSTDFRALVGEAIRDLDAVTFHGPYERSRMAPLLSEIDWVVVPSVWWENSPLVIQEAFLHGRPVICSDIGGMAEKVTDGVNGLHFRAGDAGSLARVMARAAGTRGLWDQLRRGVPRLPTMREHVAVLTDVYRDTLGQRRGGLQQDAI